jgi:hypothetical protein
LLIPDRTMLVASSERLSAEESFRRVSVTSLAIDSDSSLSASDENGRHNFLSGIPHVNEQLGLLYESGIVEF